MMWRAELEFAFCDEWPEIENDTQDFFLLLHFYVDGSVFVLSIIILLWPFKVQNITQINKMNQDGLWLRSLKMNSSEPQILRTTNLSSQISSQKKQLHAAFAKTFCFFFQIPKAASTLFWFAIKWGMAWINYFKIWKNHWIKIKLKS